MRSGNDSSFLPRTVHSLNVVKHTQKKSELQNSHLNILKIVTFKLPLSEWKKLGK